MFSAVKVAIIEREKGWGAKIDDWMICLTALDAEAFRKDFNSRNTADVVPDYYMAVEGSVIPIELNDVQFKKLEKLKRIYLSQLIAIEMELILKPIKAYTIYTPIDEMRSVEKGLYKDRSIADVDAKGSGWYGSDGTVREKENVYEDEAGALYQVFPLAKFTDVEKAYKEKTLASIKSKLTPAELELLGLK